MSHDRKPRVYIEPRDWWVGYYRGDDHHYVCPLPCVVIRWRRAARSTDEPPLMFQDLDVGEYEDDEEQQL